MPEDLHAGFSGLELDRVAVDDTGGRVRVLEQVDLHRADAIDVGTADPGRG